MSQYPNSYYATSLSQQKDALPTLIDDHECDLCVIGGGFSGPVSYTHLTLPTTPYV